MSDNEITYRYFITNLITNQVIGEVPLTGVSYERALKDAGSFSGTLSLAKEIVGIDVYNATMPGKNAIYVLRNGVCVWGGVIWSRSYDVVGKTVSINANEFTSYFQHRKIWKSWNLTKDNTLVYVDPKNTDQLIVELDADTSDRITIQEGVAVELSFLDKRGYNLNGHFRVNKDFSNAKKITVDKDALQWNVHNVSHVFQTKEDGQFDVVSRQVTAGSKEVRITTDTPHMLSVGSEVTIENLEKLVDPATYKTYKTLSTEYPIAAISSTSTILAYGVKVTKDSFVITGFTDGTIEGISVGANITQLSDPNNKHNGGSIASNGFDCRVTKVDKTAKTVTFSSYLGANISPTNTPASRTGTVYLKFENQKSGYIATADKNRGELLYSIQPKDYSWAGKVGKGGLIKLNGIKKFQSSGTDTVQDDKVFGFLSGDKTRYPYNGGTATAITIGGEKVISLSNTSPNNQNTNAIKPGMKFTRVSGVVNSDTFVKNVINATAFTLEVSDWTSGGSITFDLAEEEFHTVGGFSSNVIKTMQDYHYQSKISDFAGVPSIYFKRKIGPPNGNLINNYLSGWIAPTTDASFNIVQVDVHDYPYTKSEAAVCVNTEDGETTPVIKVIDSKTFIVNSSCEAKYDNTSTNQGTAKIAWDGKYQATMYTHTDTYEQVRYFLGKVYEDFVSIENRNPFLNNLDKTFIRTTKYDTATDLATITTGFRKPVYSKTIYFDYNSLKIIAKIGLYEPYSQFNTTEDVDRVVTITGSDTSINGTFFIKQIDGTKSYVDYELNEKEQRDINKYSLASASRSGGFVTYTTNQPHNMRVGQIVTVGGLATNMNVYNTAVLEITDTTIKVATTYSGTATDSSPNANIFTSDRLIYETRLPVGSSVITFGKHDLSAGNNIEIRGLTRQNYDGVFKVSSVLDEVTFTYKPQFESLEVIGVELSYLVNSYVVTLKLNREPNETTYDYIDKYTNITVSGLGAPYDGTHIMESHGEIKTASGTEYQVTYKISGASGSLPIHPMRLASYAQRKYGTSSSITAASYVAEIGGTKTKSTATGRGVSTFTTGSAHSFTVGEKVVISNVGGEFTQLVGNTNAYSEYVVTVSSVPSNTTFTVSSVATASNESLWRLKNNLNIEIAKKNTSTSPSNATARAFDDSDNRPTDIYPKIKIDNLPTVDDLTSLTTQITGKAFNAKTKAVYLQLNSDPGFAVGQTVFIQNADDTKENIFDGYYTISSFSKWDDNKYQIVYVSSNQKEKKNTGTFGKKQILTGYKKESANTDASATVYSQVISGSYGSFTENSDPIIEFSTYEDSGNYQRVPDYRGDELKNVGDYLSEYSDKYIVKPNSTKVIRNVYGFEYRIDCVYDNINSTFRRVFTFLPISYPNPPIHGEVSPPSRFGADKIVFEYPGNISSVTLEESAEEASTRFFMVGSDGGTGTPDASKTYVGVAHRDLLADNWPLLDSDESNDKLDFINDISENAYRYLNETKPPSGVFQISVVGNLDPVVNTYKPGDWCSIIVNDKFVKDRLASDLEPRNDVIVRKILSYTVEVPDAPSVPESVNLNLITEWDVDNRGQQ
jgi:hypothetical protein